MVHTAQVMQKVEELAPTMAEFVIGMHQFIQKVENMKYPIFKTTKLIEQSFMQRLLKQQPEENALYEVNNLLSERNVLDISKDDIISISKKYKVNLLSTFRLNLEEFYAVILNYSLLDKKLSKEEIEDLSHIKSIFELTDNMVSEIHLKIGKKIYKQSFENAVLDGRLTKEENIFLSELEKTLRLPKEIAESIAQSIKQNVFDKAYFDAIKDNRISPDEEIELGEISRNLNIDIPQSSKATLSKLKKYWAYENLELQEIDVEVKLQKNEKCYFKLNKTLWLEERESLKKRYNYSKKNSVNEILDNNLKMLDSGILYLTDKRLIFSGSEKTSSINFDKIISISEYKNGFEVDKLTGRSVIFKSETDSDFMTIVLKRLVKE